MGLGALVDDLREREKTLSVFTAGDDDRLFRELSEFFEVQNVAVRRGEVDPDGPGEFVVLHQDGEAVAVSTLEDVRAALFLDDGASVGRASADDRRARPRHRDRPAGEDRPGSRPDVIDSLGHTTFSVSGADGADRVANIARYVGELAWRTGDGRLHVGVGDLSALSEAPLGVGADFHRKVAEAGVDVHLHGAGPAPDSPVPAVTLHVDDDPELRSARFVAFDGAGEDGDKAAMVALADSTPDPADAGGDGSDRRDCPGNGESADGAETSYRGFWTFEATLVDEVLAHVEESYLGDGG